MVWECELRDMERLAEALVERICQAVGAYPLDTSPGLMAAEHSVGYDAPTQE